jgi:hypothetical protein
MAPVFSKFGMSFVLGKRYFYFYTNSLIPSSPNVSRALPSQSKISQDSATPRQLLTILKAALNTQHVLDSDLDLKGMDPA